MLSHCSSQGCKARQQNSWATLSIRLRYCSLAVQDCKDPQSQKELCTIPALDTNSLGHCSNTEIPEEAFCKGHFFHLLMHSLKQQRKMSWSEFGLLWRTLGLPVQQLSSSSHCPDPLPLSSRDVNTRKRLLPLICWGNPCWEEWAVVWELAQPASVLSLLRLPSQGEVDFG